MDYYAESAKQRMFKWMASLRQEFSRHEPRLRELADNFQPRRARWNKTDFGNGDKLNGNIINNTPLIAVRVGASGLAASVANPRSEWFRLTTPDPELAEWGPVRAHLFQRASILRAAFSLGTFYRAIGELWGDIIWAGFGCAFMEDDPERLIGVSPEMIGEFYLAADETGDVDTVGRDIPMTVRQVVRRFAVRPDKSIDWSKVSTTVKNLWGQSNYDARVDVMNLVAPNEELERGAFGPRGMAFSSRWMEKASSDDRFLRVAGYHEFPALCPRWAARAGEAYSRGLADDAIGDAKELQHEERRVALMLDKVVNPPMVADEATRGQRHSLVSGDVTYSPRGQGEGFKPAMEIKEAALLHGKDHIFRTEDRIDRAMMVDLFLKLINDERRQPMTARQVDELTQQTALQIGPVLESLNPVLKHAIDRGDAMLERRGMMPPPPRELQGVDLNVEFQSVMHQAQKGVGIGPIRVFLGETAVLAQMRPDVLDKVNGDEILDQLADATGIAPNCVLTDEEVAKIRSARAARQKAQEQGQAMLAAAKGAKDLGTTPAPGPENALGAVLGNLSPGGATGAALQPLGPLASAGFPQPGGIA
jgi:hypothetical protein